MSGRTTRPLERFWPYVEKPEEPTADELAALIPISTRRCSARGTCRSRSRWPSARSTGPITRVPRRWPRRRRSTAWSGEVAQLRHRARFFPGDALRMRDLFEVVGRAASCDVLIDDRPIPYARDLWLPLVWFLLLP